MGTLFVYAIKSGICLTVFYIFYKFLLSRETFHRLNRVALLGILMLSIALPLFNFSATAETQSSEISLKFILAAQNNAILSEPATQLSQIQPEAAKITIIHFLLIIYISFSIFFALRSIFSIIHIYYIIRKGKKLHIGNNVILVLHTGTIAPFSWFRHIVISEKDFALNGDVIIEHEKAHIAKHHSFDTLLCEAYGILQWFNPAAWLFKRELRNIHEYQADETVISRKINKKEYQLLIIQKTVGSQMFAMANNFFQKNKLKKRIKMMSKQKSNPYLRLKYILLLPLFAVIVSAFANPRVQNEMSRISAINISDFASANDSGDTVNINIYMDENEKHTYIINGDITNIDSIDGNTIGNIIFMNDTTDNDNQKYTVTVTSSHNSGKDSVQTVIKSANNKNLIAIQDGDTVNYHKFNLQNKRYSYAYSLNRDPLLLSIQNNKINVDSLKLNINAFFINADSVEAYKVHFYNKSANLDSVFNINAFDHSLKKSLNFLKKNKLNKNFDSIQMIIVDGKQLDPDALPEPNKIGSITILKNEAAVKLYGDEARNGVIVIETKKKKKNKE